MALPERPYNRNTSVACGYVPTAVPNTRRRSSSRDGFGVPSEVLESSREAVYKECPGRAARDGAGVVELADARDSKSRVRKDVRVQVPPPAPRQAAGLATIRCQPFFMALVLEYHPLET